MEGLKNNYTRIKGVSERRRLPRLGKIRLGVKGISQKTGQTYPIEKDHFVVPQEIADVYGAAPKEIDIMFPVDDPEVVFPQRLIWYGQSKGPKCIGDGERASRLNDKGGWDDHECPCDLLKEKKCAQRAHLLVILPQVTMAGIYQIDISSYHSIVDLNSGIDYVAALVGRIAMVPLKLCRVPRETHGSGRKEIHYPLQIRLDANLALLNILRVNTGKILGAGGRDLPPVETENPEMDDGSVEEQPVEKQNGKSKTVDCPDAGVIDSTSCEKCRSRQGCPAWGGKVKDEEEPCSGRALSSE